MSFLIENMKKFLKTILLHLIFILPIFLFFFLQHLMNIIVEIKFITFLQLDPFFLRFIIIICNLFFLYLIELIEESLFATF